MGKDLLKNGTNVSLRDARPSDCEAYKKWIHKIGLHTYSFNHRMNKVANKLGFKKEGLDREVIHWKGEWINRVRYGMLHQEWNEMKTNSLR